LEEEKSLSQEDNMRSESESDESKEKKDNSENNEEDQHLPEEPENISEPDEDYEETAKSSLLPKYGCLKGCLIPILGVIIVIIAIGMIIHLKRGTIHEWLIIRIVSNTQEKVLNQLPKEIDKKAIEFTFDNVKSAIRNGKINEQDMETAIKEYLGATEGTISPEFKKAEIEKLILRLNKAISDSG
jgi:hypothetical protein